MPAADFGSLKPTQHLALSLTIGNGHGHAHGG